MAHRDTDEHARFVNWIDSWESATDDARRRSESSRDYFDGNQWTEEERRILRARGQPPVVFNLIQKQVNIVKGHEIRTRVDPEAVPREPGDEEDAKAGTDALMYEADRLHIDQKRSLITDHVIIEGYAGCLVGIEMKEKPALEAKNKKANVRVAVAMPEITADFVPWDRVIYDPASRALDFEDAKYKGVATWMDLEDAILLYAKNPHAEKDFEEVLKASIATTDRHDTLSDRPKSWSDSKRQRVRIVELYYLEKNRWYVCHLTIGGFLVWPKPTGLLDEDGNDVCPLLLTSAYVNRNNERYGMVQALKWPQDEYNKRRSKLLHALSTRQVIAEEGAVPNVQEAKTELAKPDGYVKVNAGALRDGSFQVSETGDIAQGHFQLLQQSRAELDSLGPSIQDVAEDKQVLSGTGIARLQQAATLATEPLFDSIRDIQRRIFEHIWMRIKQFKTEEYWVRVRDDQQRTGFRFVRMNQPITKAQRVMQLVQEFGVDPQRAFHLANWPEGEAAAGQLLQQIQAQMQQTGEEMPQDQILAFVAQAMPQFPGADEVMTLNDVAKLNLDIKIQVTPESTMLEAEQFEKLAILAQNGVPIPPDVLVEASQIRNKRELIERIQQAQQPDPQQAELQQQVQQLQMAMMQIQMQLGQAQAAKAAADAQKSQAQAAKAAQEAQLYEQESIAEVQKDQAQAAKLAAEAGAITGGANSPDTAADNYRGGPTIDPSAGIR